MASKPQIMPISDAAALIKHFEAGPKGGYAATPYRCPADHLTIGWGHRIQPHEQFPTPLTEEQANELLKDDLLRLSTTLARLLPQTPLTPSMTGAILSFMFNIGAGAFAGSTMLSQLSFRAYRAAADQFLRWDKATVNGQKVALAGLTRRRQAERDLFLRDGFPP